jgi:methylthioribose-1-phosphate isomerase
MAVRTIRWDNHNRVIMLDQRLLPNKEIYRSYKDYEGVAQAIRDMVVRGAPAIGVAAAMGVALGAVGVKGKNFDREIERIFRTMAKTRPTAVNLFWALERMRRIYAEKRSQGIDVVKQMLKNEALKIYQEDIAANRQLGKHGAQLLGNSSRIMTHCNAGALATCGWGTATAPLFLAHAEGIALHVFVSETRPRLQGANLTAWELAQRGIPHTLFVDGASGLLMRRRDVDVVLVGADRVARNGDVCNKIGTYGKALAAADNGVPFYAAVPSPTLDPALASGEAIPIEARESAEVLAIAGNDEFGHLTKVGISPPGTRAINYAFDVTPARLVTGLVTERGVAEASAEGIAALFPEHVR